MPVRRALVECVVLSLHDRCLFYPCCRACFSKIDLQRQDTARVRCFQCGTSSVREQVDYRYRLALRVAHDRHMFGVTVFGSCLNPLFGIPASGLQRLLEDSEEPTVAQTRFALLIQAVEDCFIGRHFIFGIKVLHAGTGPLFGGQQGGPTGSSSKEPVHFIASQITLPKAAAQVGCTVVSYYRTILQKAAEGPLECTGPRTAFRPLAPPHQSPHSSFNSTLSGSCLLSLPRSLRRDRTLLPTPPWQQSLGLVTSSAEQEEEEEEEEEEGGGSQQSGGELTCRQPDSQRSPHCVAAWQSAGWEDRDGDAEWRVSPPSQSVHRNRRRSGRSLTGSPASPVRRQADGNTPTRRAWSSPSQPGPSGTVPLERDAETKKNNDNYNASSSASVVWEDMPFSESLAEFLCEENERFDGIAETEPMLIAPHGRETTGDDASNSSYAKKSAAETPDTRSRCTISLDVADTAALSYGGDFTSNSGNQACGDVGWNASQTGDTRPPEWEPEDEGGGVCSSIRKREGDDDDDEEEEEEEEMCDGEGVYHCSADLFGGSPMISGANAGTRAQMTDAHPETRPDTGSRVEAEHPTQPAPNAQDPKDGRTDVDLSESSSVQDQHSYLPDTPVLSSNEGAARRHRQKAQKGHSHTRDTEDSTDGKEAAADRCEYSLRLDFIPSSQSTPLTTRAAPVGLHAPARRTRAPGELDSRPGLPRVPRHTSTGWGGGGSDNPVEAVSPLCKSDEPCVDSRHPCTGRHAERTQAPSAASTLTPKRRSKRTFWKPEQEPKRILAAQQRMRLQKRRALSRGSAQRIDTQVGGGNSCDASICGESVCDRSECDASVCNDTKDESMVPPTADRTQHPVRRLQTDDRAKDCTLTQVNCKRTLLYRTTPPPPQRRQTGPVHRGQTGDVVCTRTGDGERTGSGPRMSGDEVGDLGSVGFALRDESGMCDWSRDLFSDSF